MTEISGNASEPKILDACCGSRMFWFDKSNGNAIFMDNRELDCILCDGRTLNIHPDVMADFRDMPFDDGQFKLVVFDPPHLIHAGKDSWLANKYGRLSSNWKNDLRDGFRECMRVLVTDGILIFKWNEQQVAVSDVLDAIGQRPLFGTKRVKKDSGQTIWLVFMKEASQ